MTCLVLRNSMEMVKMWRNISDQVPVAFPTHSLHSASRHGKGKQTAIKWWNEKEYGERKWNYHEKHARYCLPSDCKFLFSFSPLKKPYFSIWFTIVLYLRTVWNQWQEHDYVLSLKLILTFSHQHLSSLLQLFLVIVSSWKYWKQIDTNRFCLFNST